MIRAVWPGTGRSPRSTSTTGNIASVPSLVRTGPGALHVYVRGTNNHLYEKYYTTDQGWSAWQDLGGNLT